MTKFGPKKFLKIKDYEKPTKRRERDLKIQKRDQIWTKKNFLK